MAREREYRANNHAVRVSTLNKLWYENNKPRAFANSRAYTAAKMRRLPSWADRDAIHWFYECCPKGCHVDHIIPLRGKLVSGLHVAENLQWLSAADNYSKGNRYLV